MLAVSGGPDSTALMVLVARWSERPPTLVVTVDHGLRPEAAEEARLVAGNAEKLGLPWRVMRAPGRPGGGNLQDWARRARYACLATAAREAGYDTILTAHHQDDQAETFLLRLARGSGVYGLAAMPEAGTFEGLALVRPLLDVPRAELARIAAESGLATVADPSNEDFRFDRVRMRRLMPALAESGLTARRLAETAGRLGRAAAALDHYAGALLKERFRADAFGRVAGSAAAIVEAPEEVGLRALALLLKAVGGADYTPPLDPIEALRSAILAAPEDAGFRRTLHGVVVSLADGEIAARREWGRAGLSEMAAPPGATLVWDRRFRVEVPRLSAGLSIGPLGRSLRRFRAAAADAATIRALPGLFAEGSLVAVPDAVSAVDDAGPLAHLTAECLVGSRLGLPAGAAGTTN